MRFETRVLTPTDHEYPSWLRQVQDRPPVVYVRGQLPPDRRCVASVGTRQPSTFGKLAARGISRFLAAHGWSIVSGLAIGVTPPAKTRRKRGPNKAKPGTFTVETKARMQQEEIIKLLTAHATAQLGTDVAANMTLQVSDEGELRPLGDVLPQGARLQFATAIKTEE